MLNITPTAPHAPGYCSASGSLAGPFLQTGTSVRGVRVQISVPWLLSIAPELGLVPKADLDEVTAAYHESIAEQDVLIARVDEFDEALSGVCEGLVTFLAVQRSRETLLDELKAAREAIDTLTARVDALEATDAHGA